MDPKTLLHFNTQAEFNAKLSDGTVSATRHLVFIDEGGKIWCRGKYYTDQSKLDETVEGADSSEAGNIVIFDSTDGKSVADSGYSIQDIIQEVTNSNVNSATKLQTPRKINGTDFDGTADITTAKWGNSRTITLSGHVSGNANVDGGSNVTITTKQVLTSQTVTSAANVPATTDVVIININTSQTLTFTSIPSENKEIHVLIRNTGSSEITVTLSSTYVLGGDPELVIDAGTYGEVNCMVIDDTVYVRGIGS